MHPAYASFPCPFSFLPGLLSAGISSASNVGKLTMSCALIIACAAFFPKGFCFFFVHFSFFVIDVHCVQTRLVRSSTIHRPHDSNMRKCVPFADHFPFSCVIKVNQAYTETAISKEEADMELKCERLSRQFRDKKAVDQVSFTIASGVHALLGANGSGRRRGSVFPHSIQRPLCHRPFCMTRFADHREALRPVHSGLSLSRGFR